MDTSKKPETIDANDGEKKSTIRASVGVIDDLVFTSNELSRITGKLFNSNEQRLIGLLDFVRLNLKEVKQ